MTRFIGTDEILGARAASALSRRTDEGSARRLRELKKQLSRLVHVVTDDDDDDHNFRIGVLDQISNTLNALKDLKFHPSPTPPHTHAHSSIAVPDHFLCPISSELMSDPVIIASGQTYDRAYIEAWLAAGNRTCPKTKQVLTHTMLTPNILVRRMIQDWCESEGVESPRCSSKNETTVSESVSESVSVSVSVSGITLEERRYVAVLLERIILGNNGGTGTCDAVKELRALTKKRQGYREYLREADAIGALTRVLMSDSDGETKEHAVTAMLNMSIHEPNKEAIGANGDSIRSIVEVVRSGVTQEARGNAAATLFSLSATEENKARIGEVEDAIPALAELLGDERSSPMARKDCASAIFSLCRLHDNRVRCARAEGLVSTLVRLASDRGCGISDESLSLLAMLCNNSEAAHAMSASGALGVMSGIVKERQQDNHRSKENAVVVLHCICSNDSSLVWQLRGDLDCFDALVDVSATGTSRARRKSLSLLERFRRLHHTSTV